MLLGARQFFERRGAPTPSLPYDAEVGYLENTGKTQYIDTGIVGGEGLRILSVITPTEAAYDKYAIGAWGTNARIYIAYQYHDNRWGGGYGVYYAGNTDMVINQTVELGVEYTTTEQILSLDGVERQRFAKSSSYTTPTASIYLFGVNANGFSGGNSFTCQIGATKMWMNDVLVRDFIPVLFTNEQGVSEGAMYDRVSGALFRNAGTGAFTIGPDKS